MASYNHKISDQSKVKFDPVSRELKNTESDLPPVTSSDEGKVLTVDSSGEWVADEPSGIPFSTSEVKIGKMGNKDVYQKTFEVNNIENPVYVTISNTGITERDKILSISALFKKAAINMIEYIQMIPLNNSNENLAVSLESSGSGIAERALNINGSFSEIGSDFSAIITIVYVKNNS